MVHLTSSFNCTLVVALDGIFISHLFGVFFSMLCSCLYGLSCSPRPYLYGTKYSPWLCSIARSWCCSGLRADIAWFCCRYHFVYKFTAPPIKDQSAPNIGRNGNAPPRFTVGNIRFFVVVFFILIPILVLAFIAAQVTAATTLSLKAESLATMRLSALSVSTSSAAYQ